MLLLGLGVPARAQDEPNNDSASDKEKAERQAQEEENRDILLHGMREHRLRNLLLSPVGSYGELTYTHDLDSGEAVVDLQRLVLFVSHEFNGKIRFYSEIEIEHALAGAGKEGEVAIEQAYLDYDLNSEKLGVRVGGIPVPMGIVNEVHEPPIFPGVQRPLFDRLVIPTTWREPGVGIHGRPTEEIRYQLYLMAGLNPTGFNSASGIRGGRGELSEAPGRGLAVAGRGEYAFTQWLVAGVSAYASAAGPNAGDLVDSTGAEIDVTVPVVGYEADVRLVSPQGIQAKAAFAGFSIGDTNELAQAVDPVSGDSLGIDVPSSIYGGYAEVGYDVLHHASTNQALLPFVRVERYDTGNAASVFEVGVSYRPIINTVFKADYVLVSPDGSGSPANVFELGAGWMF